MLKTKQISGSTSARKNVVNFIINIF